MKKDIKKQITTLLFIFIPLIGFILFVLIGLYQRQDQLEKEPIYTTGIIVETYIGTKVRHFVRFEFLINDKIFDGHQQFFPRIENVELGDTCEVVFAKSNPEINAILTNKDKSLKIRRTAKDIPRF